MQMFIVGNPKSKHEAEVRLGGTPGVYRICMDHSVFEAVVSAIYHSTGVVDSS